MKQSEWDAFTEALKSVDTWAEDVCIEVDVEDTYEMIDDLPGVREYDPQEGYFTDVDWDFLSRFPEIEKEVLKTFEIWSQVEADDRHTRRAEQGWSDC